MSSLGAEFDSALVAFFVEARDMLRQMEESLLALEEDPTDRETVNTLFRAAHTVKGSAGLFGLDPVVSFTHLMESVLDRVREGELGFDTTLGDVMFKSCDALAGLLQHAESAGADASAGAPPVPAVAAALRGYLGGTAEVTGTPEAAAPGADAASRAGVWHVSLRFGPDTFRNGFDPLSVIAYLEKLGEVTAVAAIDDFIPPIEAIDPESCHLGFEIRLRTAAPRAEIDAAFDFVRDDCRIRLLEPEPLPADLVALIRDLPEDTGRLGDLLVACGALTRAQLDAALADQNARRGTGADAAPRIGEILVERGEVARPVLDAALEKQSKARSSGTDASRFLRVPADKLDQLINLVGELVIAGAGAEQLARNAGQSALVEANQHVSGLVEEIRNGALSLRMVQIGETFGRFRRVVRDVAAELAKDVRLELEGTETELDKSVVEKIGDPLMHLVRNALDHGVEPPADREAAGKPRQAVVRLSARHDSGNIVIQVEDDGRGMDRERILAKAIERGIVAAGQTLSDAEILNLIFEPGFSTAASVTNLSGRGVGMDVVRRNIEALRGTVSLRSVKGHGSTVEIRLPLTLAIIDGFLVRAGGSHFVVPLDLVVECIDGASSRLQHSGNGVGHLDLRGRVLPFVELAGIFGAEGDQSARRSVVVVRSAGVEAGLVVDQLAGEYQTVIKPLGRLFRNLVGIGGSTILGSGEVALILDVPALLKLAAGARDDARGESGMVSAADVNSGKQ